jgi:hypothetical protein
MTRDHATATPNIRVAIRPTNTRAVPRIIALKSLYLRREIGLFHHRVTERWYPTFRS